MAIKKMVEKVWLKRLDSKDGWNYGLGRYADGSIRVAEIHHSHGTRNAFGRVGGTDEGEAFRLYPNERKKIILDLYKACRQEMIEWGWDMEIVDDEILEVS